MAIRKWSDVLVFELLVCCVSLFFSVLGTIAPQILLTFPANGISVGSNTLLLLGASLTPGLVILFRFEECRAALVRLGAGYWIYLLSLFIGFVLPFVSYIGAQHSYPFWNSNITGNLIRLFFINLLLSPLWEDNIWRGYFYSELRSFLALAPAMFTASVGWTIWHLGFLFYLYKSGIPIEVLSVFVIQVFLMGIIQCSVFTLGHDSLFPCILLHTAFNASTAIYYGSYNRAADIGSYIAETVAALFVAGVLFRITTRRTRSPGIGSKSSLVPRHQPSL